MPTQETIATALMTVELPNEDVAGLMLEMANIRTPVVMPTPPSTASVEKVLNKGWAKTATAVLSGAKAFLGTRLLKHSSIQVRRLLAEHGTDDGVLRSLHNWAISKDKEALDSIVRRVDPLWLLSNVEQGVIYSPQILSTIAHRAVQAEPVCIERIFNLAPELRNAMLVSLVTSIASGEIANCDLRRTLTVLDEPAQRDAARNLVRCFDGIVSQGLLDQVVAFAPAWKELVSLGLRSVRSYEPSAASMLIEANPDQALFVLSTDWDMVLFDQLLGLKRFDVASAILTDERIPKLTPEELSAVLAVADSSEKVSQGYRSAQLNRDLLGLVEFELETSALFNYLRNTDSGSTWKWLCGKYPQKPRPGEPTALVADRGLAFGSILVPVAGRYQYNPAPIEDIASTLAADFDSIAGQPWCDEFVDACGYHAFEALLQAYNRATKPYIAARFTKELGGDVDLWRSALAQFTTSKLSIGKTLTAARRLGAARQT